MRTNRTHYTEINCNPVITTHGTKDINLARADAKAVYIYVPENEIIRKHIILTG